MSTSKNFLMNKGMSYKVTAKARGYYDYSTILSPNGTAITYDMTSYDGLNYNVDLTYNAYRDATIDFSQTKLPYLGLANQSLQTSEYCLKATSQNYDLNEYAPVYTNITVIGSPTINNDVVSNFSISNYIAVKKKKSDMTVYLKVTTGSDLSSSQNVASFNGYFDLQVYNNVFGCYDWGARTYYDLLTNITANTTYYWMIKISETNKTKKYSYSTDGKTYTEAKTFTDSGMSYISTNDFYLGIHAANKNSPFYGSIDLSKSSIQEKLPSGDFVGYNLNEATLEPTGTTKSYAGIYDPDYTDTGAAKTLNCFSNGNKFVVLSEKENYQNYTYLGTVNIPKHKISWNNEVTVPPKLEPDDML